MKKALLVNDSRFESLILKDLLSSLDYDVEIADEYDAMYQVEQFEPDLVVANYIMQETRGDKIIQLLKAGRPNLRCLISSNNPLHKDDFKDIGLDGILRTPVSMFTLKDILRRVDESLDLPTSNSNIEDRLCIHCGGDLGSFSKQIVFCPFCGEEMED